jgi:hypothetical protein
MQEAYSHCTWFVSLTGGALHAEFRAHPVAPAPTLPFEPKFLPRQHDTLFGGDVPNLDKMPPMRASALFENEQGYLVGFDSGRWGGGLYWYDREGELRQGLLGANVVRLVPRGRRMLVFTSLAHLAMDAGAAHFLEFDGQSWHLLRTRELTARPLVLADEPDGALLVIGERRIVRVTPDERVEPLFLSKHGFWDPNSVVREPDGTLYLGSRYVVIRLQPTADGYDETWLAPEGATRPRAEARDAECG